MHRFRSWTLDPPEWRTQRNRSLPVEGGDGSTLSLDFTAGVLDSRLSFERLSTATFINSSGFVKYAGHNLFYNTAYSGLSGLNPSLTSSGWSYSFTTGSATFNGDGSVTMTAAGQRIALNRSAGFAGAGRRVIVSVDILTSGDTGLTPFQIIRAGSFANEVYYIDSVLYSSGNVIGPCTLSFAYDSATSVNTTPYFGVGVNGNATGTVTFANPRFGLWDDAAPFPYLANTSTTAERHDPRFDHDPATLAPKGLLIEGQATNLLRPSNTGFNLYNTQKVGGAGLEPATTTTGIDGTQSAVSFTVTQSGGTTPFIDARAGTGTAMSLITVTASTVYTFSFYWKAGQSFPANLTRIYDESANPDAIIPQTSSTDEPAPNGFTRRIVVFTTPVGCTSIYCAWLYGSQANGNTYTVTSCQLELGSGASSYIPTGASTATRALDSCVMTGTNFSSWFAGATEGVLYAEHERPRSESGNTTHDHASVGTRYTSGGLFSLYVTGIPLMYPTALLWPTGGAIFPGGFPSSVPVDTKAAARWFDGNDATNFSNGVQGTTGAGSGTVTPTMLCIGAHSTDGVVASRDFLNACVRRVKFWPVALPNSQIIALTAP